MICNTVVSLSRLVEDYPKDSTGHYADALAVWSHQGRFFQADIASRQPSFDKLTNDLVGVLPGEVHHDVPRMLASNPG